MNILYEKASKILQQVLGIQRATLSVEDVRLLHTQNLLVRAHVRMTSGHHGKAAELLEQMVGIQERMLEPEDSRRLRAQYYLALAYIGMGSGHYGKAAELLGQVVGIEERTLAPDNHRRLQSQRQLEVHKRIKAEKNAESRYACGEGARPSSCS